VTLSSSSRSSRFCRRLTALTGETGAGKSILIDALSLALGERGDAAMVRNGCERAEISANSTSANCRRCRPWLAEQGLEGDAGVCLMRRVLDASGRSRGFINGSGATQQQMRAVGEFLLDIHGQHAHQSLLRVDAQREILDGHANLRAMPLRLRCCFATGNPCTIATCCWKKTRPPCWPSASCCSFSGANWKI
jgi:DNA repair protein RecN (Recombination protein N)